MAIVLPFRALRPDREYVKEVAALPYDVYSRAEAREAVAGHPLSFLNIDRPETQFPETQDMYAPEVYDKAAEMLRARTEEGIFVRDERPCFYVYELTMNGRTQTGIVALSSVDDYLNGVCLKHENTVEAKEQDRIRHVDVCSAQTGPIFLCYRAKSNIRSIVQAVKDTPAFYDFVSEDGVRHRVFRISDSGLISLLSSEFAGISATYIADGHHRAASAVKVALRRRAEHPDYTGKEEFNYFLSVLFPDEELRILDYNRVVKDLNGLSEEGFLSALSGLFTVEAAEAAVHPQEKGEIGMLLGTRWYRLRALPEVLREGSGDPVKQLDVSLLQDKVLAPVLGIGDPRTDARIEFVGGIRGLGELEKRVRVYSGPEGPAVAFSMYPTGIDELLDVADAGLLMPPKSTWFEPKLRSGIFIHEIER